MTTKTNEQLLADYKKSNKERRKKIVEKAGFKNESDYLASLKGEKKEKKKSSKKESKVEDDGMLDMVVAFDTTGSMASYLGAVKEHVKKIIPELFSDNPNLKMKIVAFGDYCDMEGRNKFGKAYQESPLTNSQNDLIKFVNGAKSTGGGDSDEFYELVIKKVVEETPWRKEAKKAVLLIADCGPHPLGYTYGNYVVENKISWKEEAKKAAAKGIQFDTLAVIPSYTKSFYEPLSEITGGICMPFKSSGKSQEVFRAATSVRGSSMSKESFRTAYTAAIDSGDEELIGTYKSLSKLL